MLILLLRLFNAKYFVGGAGQPRPWGLQKAGLPAVSSGAVGLNPKTLSLNPKAEAAARASVAIDGDRPASTPARLPTAMGP